MTTYLLDARTATDHFPGIGRYVSNLAHQLLPELAATERLLLLFDPRVESRWQLPESHPQLERLPLPVSPFTLKQQWAVPRAVRHTDAVLYHSPYYMLPLRVPLPTLVTAYDFIPEAFPQSVSPQARWLSRGAKRLAFRRADHILAISEATRADLLVRYPVAPAKVSAVPLAPAPSFQPQPTAVVAALRTRYQLTRPYLLYLGINKPHKNLLRLLAAWERVIAQHPDPPELIIAGAWDSRYADLRQAAEAPAVAPHVRLLGPVADVDLPALYSGAELFVFPSLYEGFGFPVIEALACGTAVACARASSLPEVAGEAAAYFDPLNVDDITDILLELLQSRHKREALAAKGPAQAARFSWGHTARNTLALYRHITNPTAPAAG